MGVSDGYASEETSVGGVSVPVVGVLALAVADKDELAWRIRVPGGSSSQMMVAIA